ncbi:Rossmann-fold NAD(P)-binding domain-containing protein [Streptomyces lancefieldiae]|uniref:Uncharacterized protein n=1 Tax=Streptomyces lancefieldiae TaxID=3075520 RepID=A0ABU3AG10_9ACTN|nr:hypothetical protein [Streptomyces sp. DSM 40712]MDT0609111.1 hypothetical protein [Streptomyces sp. DSM 40712]
MRDRLAVGRVLGGGRLRLARNADPVSRFTIRRILPVMTLTPFATSRNTAGRCLAEVVLGTIQAPTGSYVDRSRVKRSSQESYDPQREGELWQAAERFTAAWLPGVVRRPTTTSKTGSTPD